MQQLLLSEAAYARIADKLEPFKDRLDIVTVTADAGLRRNGKAIAEIDPQIVYTGGEHFLFGTLEKYMSVLAHCHNIIWTQTFAPYADEPVGRIVMARGVRMTISPAYAPPMAEFVLAHALSLLHPIGPQAQVQAQKRVQLIRYREVSAAHIVLVGYGAVGREVAKRFAPFGARFSLVRRTAKDGAITLADLPPRLPHADLVILACKLNDETRRLADEALFGALKSDAIFMNVGRAELADDRALRSWLDRNERARAVINIHETEPLSPDSWHWTHPRVRLASFAAFGGASTIARVDALFLENLQRYLAGEPLLFEVNAADVGPPEIGAV